MSKFGNKHNEFYEWSRTIHDEVVTILHLLIVKIYFKTMKNIPMKVETKTLAITDPTAVANDRLTGETSIIAFRATVLTNGFSNYKPGI